MLNLIKGVSTIANKDYTVFKSKVVAELKLRKLKYRDLAKMTGKQEYAIRFFMADNIKREYNYEPVAEAISEALGIEL